MYVCEREGGSSSNSSSRKDLKTALYFGVLLTLYDMNIEGLFSPDAQIFCQNVLKQNHLENMS